MEGAVAGLILVGALVVFAAIVVAKSVALIPQAEAAVMAGGVVSGTLSAGS